MNFYHWITDDSCGLTSILELLRLLQPEMSKLDKKTGSAEWSADASAAVVANGRVAGLRKSIGIRLPCYLSPVLWIAHKMYSILTCPALNFEGAQTF